MSFAVLLEMASVAEMERLTFPLATDVVTAPTARLDSCKNFTVIKSVTAILKEHVPPVVNEVKPRYAVEPADTKIWSFGGTTKVWLVPSESL